MAALCLTDITPMAGEPTVIDAKLGEALGYSRAGFVRRLIAKNEAELLTHGRLCRVGINPSEKGGRPTEAYYLNESQALLICMFARTPKAAVVRRELIEVFLAWRRNPVVDQIGAALRSYLVQLDKTVEIMDRLEARFDALEAVGKRLAKVYAEPREAAMALTHAAELWFDQKAARRPSFWGDIDVRGLVLATYRQMTIDQAMELIRERCGEARTPKRSALGRFWQRLDRLRAENPSLRMH